MSERKKLGVFITLEKFAEADIEKLCEEITREAEASSEEFYSRPDALILTDCFGKKYSPYSHGCMKGEFKMLLLDLQRRIQKEIELKQKLIAICAEL